MCKQQLFDKRILPIYLTSGVENLVSKLWRHSKQLSDFARIFAGIGGVTPKLTTDKSVPGNDCLRGNNIDRYTYTSRPVFLLPDELYSQRDLDEHALPRIVCQDIVAHIEKPEPHIRITATLDLTERLTHETVINIALKPETQTVLDLRYLLGLLNSRLISWYVYRFIFNSAIRTMHFRPGYADYAPIHIIDLANPQDKKQHDGLVALVERMLALQVRLKPLRGTGLTEEHDILREVERVDAEIDNLVYDLYGLTEAERRLVEGDG